MSCLFLTSEANRLLHLHPLTARHGHQSPLLPPHQAHGDDITNHILPGLHSNHTAIRNQLSEKPNYTKMKKPACVWKLTFCRNINSSLTAVFNVRLNCSPCLPLQVVGGNGLVADGTLGPALVAKREVVQHARPAEDVSTPGDAGCHRRVQTDRARRHLMTVDALQTYKKRTNNGLSLNASVHTGTSVETNS